MGGDPHRTLTRKNVFQLAEGVLVNKVPLDDKLAALADVDRGAAVAARARILVELGQFHRDLLQGEQTAGKRRQ
ncbi:hypothetical protein NKG94_12495 [Micromonospora sp. M12]